MVIAFCVPVNSPSPVKVTSVTKAVVSVGIEARGGFDSEHAEPVHAGTAEIENAAAKPIARYGVGWTPREVTQPMPSARSKIAVAASTVRS